MLQLMWFRTDLRVTDNSALTAAMQAGPTVAVFLLSPGQWQQHDDAPCKVDFWLRNLGELSRALQHLNVPLLIREADHWSAAPNVLGPLAQELQASAVHVNEEYGVNESRRDEVVAAALDELGVNFRSHLDRLLFKPGSVLTRTGTYFKVYSQFRGVCYQRLHTALPKLVTLPKAQAKQKITADPIPHRVAGFDTPNQPLRDAWPAGEEAARERLQRFADEWIEDYHDNRDFPIRPGTSQLSAYLAAGVLSPRQCLHAALNANAGEFESGSQGAVTWINELIWREFYTHILVGYPRVSMGRAFRPETEALPWRKATNDLQAWQQGRTGIPIIDAAMRQLLETGWMHNRLRMVVAMYLTKNLLIDWRRGEEWFWDTLVDADGASNPFNWQWLSLIHI